MRRRRPDLQGAEIGRRTGEAVGHIVQNHATIHNRGAGLEAKIEIIRPIEPLNRLRIQ